MGAPIVLKNRAEEKLRYAAIVTAFWPTDCIGERPSAETEARARVLGTAIYPHVPWIFENVQRPVYIKRWKGIKLLETAWLNAQSWTRATEGPSAAPPMEFSPTYEPKTTSSTGLSRTRMTTADLYQSSMPSPSASNTGNSKRGRPTVRRVPEASPSGAKKRKGLSPKRIPRGFFVPDDDYYVDYAD